MSKISQKVRKEIGKKLAVIETYHSEVPMGAISEAVKSSGFVLVQEDNAEWSGILCGAEGEAFFRIASVDLEENGYYPMWVTNAGVRLTWYKMASGRYEIVVYLS